MTGSLFEICKSVFAAADIDKLLPFLLDLVIRTNAERCRSCFMMKKARSCLTAPKRRDRR
jgi:hypothetical protein